jgi:FkbM family methyltransferase
MRHTDFLNKKLYLHPEGDVVCDNIAKGIPAEEHLVYYFNKLIKPTDIIVEGGVYIGLHTLKFSQLAYEGHIHSFEASKRNYDLANNTLIDNEISNITLYNEALYSENKEIFLSESWTPDQDSVTDTPTNKKIKAVTIDSLQLPKVDFIKLDIEGGELDALKGAVNTINKFNPIITFEYLKHLNHPSPIPFLKENNYDVYQIDNHWDYVAFPPNYTHEDNI